MIRIRIDHCQQGEMVSTTWVEEDVELNRHSLIGRLLLTPAQFDLIKWKLSQTDTVDGYTSSHYFAEKVKA